MNRSYNHIKHFIDNKDVVRSKNHRPGSHELNWHPDRRLKHDANQLDDKQHHTGFDYYEYNMLKFTTPGWAQTSLDRSTSSFNFQEHLEDSEHNQARHQAIHGHGRGETCYIQW